MERPATPTHNLQPGVNTVQIKVSQNTGVWGFAFEILDFPANVTWQSSRLSLPER
jgi:hypothetical protein